MLYKKKLRVNYETIYSFCSWIDQFKKQKLSINIIFIIWNKKFNTFIKNIKEQNKQNYI